MNRLPLHSALAHNSKIEVDMYCPFFLPAYGGAELATLNLTKELKNHCSVVLHTFNWTQDLSVNRKYGLSLSSPHPEQELISGVLVCRYPVTNLPVVKDFSFGLISSLKSSDASIVHFQGLTRLLSASLLQRALGKKIKVLTTHGFHEALEITRQYRSNAVINHFFMNLLNNMDHIIALSKTDVNMLLNLGLDRTKITLIPNGIDEGKFGKTRRYVERNDRLKILCVSRFDRNKNYESLVLALKRLRNSFEFHAYFVGSVSDYSYLREIMNLIEKSGLTESITIGLSLDDAALADCYLSCDLFVLPSTVETGPLVVLEAMYAGLPVVATNVGFVREIVENGINGFVVPKNNIDALVESCSQLLGDEKTRKEMGTNNKHEAKRYTWKAAASSTRTLYERLLRSP